MGYLSGQIREPSAIRGGTGESSIRGVIGNGRELTARALQRH
jgi:hypothetical protein